MRSFLRSPEYNAAYALFLACLVLGTIWRDAQPARGGVLWWLTIGLALVSFVRLLLYGRKAMRDRRRSTGPDGSHRE